MNKLKVLKIISGIFSALSLGINLASGMLDGKIASDEMKAEVAEQVAAALKKES